MARILLGEDDTAMREFARLALEMDGHEVVPYHDGGEVAHALQSPHLVFDLVLIDVRLPVMDGIELSERARIARPNAPVVLMTGYRDERLEELLAQRLIAGLITKPFTLEKLRDAIAKTLSDQGRLRGGEANQPGES